jgi:uncharacterized LabA/DUF88 family protein
MPDSESIPKQTYLISYLNEKVGVFIDGPNTYLSLKGLNIQPDYIKMIQYFEINDNRLMCFRYYHAVYDRDENVSSNRFVHWLKNSGIGVQVISKSGVVRHPTNTTTVLKGNMDIDIAVDMMTMAPHLDHLILMTGDGDFIPLVKALQLLGKRVTIISTQKQLSMTGATCSIELAQVANSYIDFDQIREDIGMDKVDLTKINDNKSLNNPPLNEEIRNKLFGDAVGAGK